MTWIVDMDDYEFAAFVMCFPSDNWGIEGFLYFLGHQSIKSIRGWIHQPHPATTYLLWTAADLGFDLYPCVMSWLNFLEDPKIGWETYWEDDQAALRLGWEYAQTTWGIWDRRSNKFCRSNLGTIHWQAPLSENEQWKWIVNPDFKCLIVP